MALSICELSAHRDSLLKLFQLLSLICRAPFDSMVCSAAES